MKKATYEAFINNFECLSLDNKIKVAQAILDSFNEQKDLDEAKEVALKGIKKSLEKFAIV